MEFDLESQLTSSEDWASISNLFATEADHMISTVGAIDLCARREAVSLVLQVQSDCNLEPIIAYLAISYIDRYLTKREIPRGKPWVVRLLSISCLSLASKMNTNSIAVSDFQRKEGFIFDSQTIQRMELLVLGALDWRMLSITPFSFLRFFITFFPPGQLPLLQTLKAQATQIILKAQIEIKMLEFKPSVVAASALLSAAYEFFPNQFLAFRAALTSCEFVNKEKLWECSRAMAIPTAAPAVTDGCEDSASTGTLSSSNTPVTVLGRLCSSTESEPTV
ncbi:hypothetical protein Cni_G00590 [Canna indica]|uniref:B-like cyclin n=1 Tax=Canna indica TaxID=4628 RepID=A0AAQ3PZS4_9LILI|nr:hypothetical protein Cni_G00590 [Canna indica]